MVEKEIAGYQLLKLLGSGGMGVTYLAVRKGLAGFEKKVAIKKLPPHLKQDPSLIQSLISEAKIAVRLDHPNIVSTYDLGKENDDYFIVMEYVEGINFSELLQKTHSFPSELVLYVVMEVLCALDYAHHLTDDKDNPLHIIHRDLSPDNLLLSHNGLVKLADFGLARLHNQMHKTLPGTIKGKFGYMSPEQVKGFPLDARSDLFSLGVMLYEGLSNSRLFQEENLLKTLRRMEEADVPPLRHFVPDIDPTLEQIVTKALSLDPDKRYLNAKSLYDELEAFVLPTTTEQLRRAMQEYLKLDDHHQRNNQANKHHSSCSSIQIFQPKQALIYILAQDSAFSDAFLRQLTDPWQSTKQFDFQILSNKEEQEEAIEQIRTYQILPYAVLFGGLHVAMLHPLLQLLRERKEVCKILLLSFVNEELLEMAINLCGVDFLLKTPVTLEDFVSILQDNSRSAQINRRISTMLTYAKDSEKHLQSQIKVLSQANIHAVQLLDELERKNKVIEDKNKLLERIAKTVVQTNEHKEEQTFFQGNLQELPFVDICQLLGISRKTAVLTLSCKEQRAEVIFQEGSIIHALDGEKQGESAVASIIDWLQGNFSVKPLTQRTTQTIFQPTTQLLLDLFRQKDENDRSNSLEMALPEGDWF